jgi:hypothetical protein
VDLAIRHAQNKWLKRLPAKPLANRFHIHGGNFTSGALVLPDFAAAGNKKPCRAMVGLAGVLSIESGRFVSQACASWLAPAWADGLRPVGPGADATNNWNATEGAASDGTPRRAFPTARMRIWTGAW